MHNLTMPLQCYFTFEYPVIKFRCPPHLCPSLPLRRQMATGCQMKQGWFLARCNTIWEKRVCCQQGHGFHIGSMTHLLLLGVDPWISDGHVCWSFPIIPYLLVQVQGHTMSLHRFLLISHMILSCLP